MYSFIDTHAHLDGDEFKEDLNDVLDRALHAGVKKILIPNINGKTIENLLQVCQTYNGIMYPMIGLHPEDINGKENYLEALDKMEQMLKEESFTETNRGNKFVAIGEVGLDFYWDDTYRKEQVEAFERQIGWAETYNLPLMIHTRSAHKELIEIMECHHGCRGVFHCFTGNAEEAQDLLSFEGFMLGIGGVATFKKSQLPEVLKSTVPISRIVLETDSPYLAPVPHRGKRNESAFLADTAKKIAEVYECTIEEVAKHTTENTLKIFKEIRK